MAGKSDGKRCPICNLLLDDYDHNYIEKHVSRCRNALKPRYVYSDLPRGRPSRKAREEFLKKREEQSSS